MTVDAVRRARWERCKCSMCMQHGELDAGRRHALASLHHLGAPLPAEDDLNEGCLTCSLGCPSLSLTSLRTSGCLCCRGVEVAPQRRPHTSGPAPGERQSSVGVPSTPAWADKTGRWSQASLASLESTGRDEMQVGPSPVASWWCGQHDKTGWAASCLQCSGQSMQLICSLGCSCAAPVQHSSCLQSGWVCCKGWRRVQGRCSGARLQPAGRCHCLTVTGVVVTHPSPSPPSPPLSPHGG